MIHEIVSNALTEMYNILQRSIAESVKSHLGPPGYLSHSNTIPYSRESKILEPDVDKLNHNLVSP